MGNAFKKYFHENFAKNLKELRERHGFEKEKDLAKHIKNNFDEKFCARQIKRQENNETGYIQSDKLYLLAEVFKVTTDYLLGREGYVLPSESNDLETNRLKLTKDTKDKIMSFDDDTMGVFNILICNTNFFHVLAKQLKEAKQQYEQYAEMEEQDRQNGITTTAEIIEQMAEDKDEILDIASYRVKREIDKLFRSYLNYNPKNK